MTKKSSHNILFIMCDQLRWDYLSCAGHKRLHTPNIDRLAEQGVRFNQAYCQAPLCGPSRASFYTGRYMSSHGSMANCDPLRPDELTLSDYISDLGYRSALIGKTHTSLDAANLASRGFKTDKQTQARLACGGFEPYTVHEGVYPDQLVPEKLAYNNFLKKKGYQGENPWLSQANSGKDGRAVDGNYLKNCKYPANVSDEHSETAFLTDQAIEFISQANKEDKPWCLHLSYIKPHWPLMAPAPYHDLYKAEDVQAVNKSEREKQGAHPVYTAFTQQEYSLNYANSEVRSAVVPTYMGLIKQVDDHLRRLFAHLEALNLWDDTLIVFTSDHGDYLGDHWLGEKDLFHDCSSRIPLIVRDPRASADSSRGTVENQLVEAIDLIPTFIDYAGGKACVERLEGYSLMPYINNSAGEQQKGALFQRRDFVVSEIDYSDRGVRSLLNIPPYDCRAYMLRSKKWKYVFYERYSPQLFDLTNDPRELEDLAQAKEYKVVLDEMNGLLFTWLRKRKLRTLTDYNKLESRGPALDEDIGVIIGRW